MIAATVSNVVDSPGDGWKESKDASNRVIFQRDFDPLNDNDEVTVEFDDVSFK